MRTRSGDQARTMCQKILASHTDDETYEGEFLEVRVDQVALAEQPNRVLGLALERGLRRSQVEVSIAYPPRCVARDPSDVDPRAPHSVHPDAIQLGFLLAQPGAGFASSVHLERFGSPARVLLTDEPRLSSSGGASMLVVAASHDQLSDALSSGRATIRTPRSVQIQLSGRLRPFVCYRDVGLEFLRRGLGEIVRELDRKRGAPIVLEFTGPSTRLLSVGDRAVLGDFAERLGAAGVLFPSDEKTEIFLRDQKRSKAHRSLSLDAGAEYETTFALDLGAVDPLVLDDEGKVRPVRDFDGRPVSQVLLGGDSGISLRDLLAAAALLKSKRVPPRVEFLLSPPSRQMLEVLARSEALVDLIATGARLIEPDRRALGGELYPVRPGGAALRNADPEDSETERRSFVASAETLAYAVAHGEMGDPRYFKRPVRITVPRALPTDDVLLARGTEVRGGAKGKGRVDKKASEYPEAPSSQSFVSPRSAERRAESHELVIESSRSPTRAPCAFFARHSGDVVWLVESAFALPQVRCVLATHFASCRVAALSSLGLLALRITEDDAELLDHARSSTSASLTLPALHRFHDGPAPLVLSVNGDTKSIDAEWLAKGPERRAFEASFLPASREIRTRESVAPQRHELRRGGASSD